ncbi:MAG: SDR family oxidoreductase [Gammaproteobacteria bacterium]|nr:SDR family oxidoreductase [Gammaproteobacteria bacterium]
MNDLTDKVAVITGASSGIGLAIAKAFAEAGANVVLVARNVDRLNAAVAEVTAAGGKAEGVSADVAREADVVALFEGVAGRHGKLDLLVNNAGIATGAPAHEMTLDAWQRTVDVNLTAAFLCSREALKTMREQKRGRIINIGSVASRVPRPNTVAYAATKSGLNGLTHALAIEGRPMGITVTMLSPGNTATGFPVPGAKTGNPEPVMNAADVARMAVTIATMPDDLLVVEAMMMPLQMPLLGRG